MNKLYRLPEVLDDILHKNKMSRRKLADKMGQTTNSVSEWVKFTGMPNIFSLINMSQALNVTTDYLLFGEDDWIVCSNEQPDKDGTYLVAWKYENSPVIKRPYYKVIEFYEGKWITNIENIRDINAEVLAWREIPEFYEL